MMATTLASLAVQIGADTRDMRRDVDQAKRRRCPCAAGPAVGPPSWGLCVIELSGGARYAAVPFGLLARL